MDLNNKDDASDGHQPDQSIARDHDEAQNNRDSSILDFSIKRRKCDVIKNPESRLKSQNRIFQSNPCIQQLLSVSSPTKHQRIQNLGVDESNASADDHTVRDTGEKNQSISAGNIENFLLNSANKINHLDEDQTTASEIKFSLFKRLNGIGNQDFNGNGRLLSNGQQAFKAYDKSRSAKSVLQTAPLSSVTLGPAPSGAAPPFPQLAMPPALPDQLLAQYYQYMLNAQAFATLRQKTGFFDCMSHAINQTDADQCKINAAREMVRHLGARLPSPMPSTGRSNLMPIRSKECRSASIDSCTQADPLVRPQSLFDLLQHRQLAETLPVEPRATKGRNKNGSTSSDSATVSPPQVTSTSHPHIDSSSTPPPSNGTSPSSLRSSSGGSAPSQNPPLASADELQNCSDRATILVNSSERAPVFNDGSGSAVHCGLAYNNGYGSVSTVNGAAYHAKEGGGSASGSGSVSRHSRTSSESDRDHGHNRGSSRNRDRNRERNRNRVSTTNDIEDSIDDGDASSGAAANASGAAMKVSGQSTSRRRGKSLPEAMKDEAYWERRRKNNEAAKRSRDSRRAKEDEVAIRAALLEQENARLRLEVVALKAETEKLRQLLLNS